MDEAATPFPWSLLAGGLATLVGGAAFLVRGAWLAALVRAQGGAPLSPREARGVPALLLASGALALFAAWGLTWAGVNGQRPYAVVLAVTAALPLAAALLAAAVVYLVLVRRLRA